MTAPQQPAAPQQEAKPVDNKELNFRMLEAKYEKQLAQERAARLEAERKAQEAINKPALHEDEDDDEPYIDHKKLNKTLNKFGQNTQTEIQKAMEVAKQKAKEELKQELWLEQNPDFFETLQHAEKFAQKSPKLAETILRMPEGFERQKLVYQTIKEMGIDKPEQKQSSVQDKIDANRRTPYYQPSGVSSGPYDQMSTGKNYSETEKKAAYEKIMAAKRQLRI